MILLPFSKKIVLYAILSVLIVIMCLTPRAYAANNHEHIRQLRIVSLSPAVTESLYLLGLKDNIVGVTIYCNRPVDAKRKPAIGTIIEPDLEKIVKLQPDLVLAMGLTNQKTLTKMKSLGLKVSTYEIPDSFSGICDIFLRIGTATGRSEEARRIVDAARTQVDEVRRRTARFKKPKVMIELGAKPFYVATKDYFVNDYLDFAGAINIFRDAPSGSVGREEAIIRNPDAIFIVTMGLSGKNERQIWKKYSSVNAVRNSRVYVIDSDNVCSPTPLSFVKSLKYIASLLHPDEAGGWK